MADAVHWVVAVRIGFTTESVRSTTAFSAIIVAVRALGDSGWNQTQFACCTGHRAYPLCSLCARIVSSRSSNNSSNSSRDVILLPTPRSKAAPERGFVLKWRRKWVVNRAVAALIREVAALFASSVVSKQFSTALSRTTALFRPLYIGHRPPYCIRMPFSDGDFIKDGPSFSAGGRSENYIRK